MFARRDVYKRQRFQLSAFMILVWGSLSESHFVQQHLHCSTSNANNRMFKWQIAYDSTSLAYLNSEDLRFVATSPYAEKEIENYNSQKELFQRYQNIIHDFWPFLDIVVELGNATLKRRVAPSVTIGIEPLDNGILSLACYIRGFYPQHIDVVWLQNGNDMKEKMTKTNILPNSDNTFSLDVYLDIEENNKHIYTCLVKHCSSTQEIRVTVDFNHGFKSGFLVGGVLAFMGIITGIIGIVLRCKSKDPPAYTEGRGPVSELMVHEAEHPTQDMGTLYDPPVYMEGSGPVPELMVYEAEHPTQDMGTLYE